jgi:hypothetical protein
LPVLLGCAGDRQECLSCKMALNGGVEDMLDAAQVVLHLAHFPGDVGEELHVLFLVAAEVVDAHVPVLSVAGYTPIALHQSRRRPGSVVVDDPAALLLHVDAFRGGVRGEEQPHGGAGVLELALDRFELVGAHAAVEKPQRVLVKSFVQEALLQVEQCLFVLGEDDQPFVVPELAADKQMLLHPLDEGFGLRVRERRTGTLACR